MLDVLAEELECRGEFVHVVDHVATTCLDLERTTVTGLLQAVALDRRIRDHRGMSLEALHYLEDVFGKMAEVQMREFGLEAIRRQPRIEDSPTRRPITVRSWYSELLGILASTMPRESAAPGHLTINKRLEVSIAPTSNGEIYPHHVHVRRFWHWMESAGFALKFGHNHDQVGGSNFDQWVLTDLGVERLNTEHPLAPGAMKRLWDKFGTDHEDSLARLEDAHRCFDHGLYRPAVVLLGLAYEELLGVVAVRLKVKWKQNAKDRLDELRKKIEGHRIGDPKTAALNALNVANSIREARNDAAHKASSTWTALEVDELLADGMRAYPKLAGYTQVP